MEIESIKPGRRNKEKLIIRFTDGTYIEAAAQDAYKLKVGAELTAEAAEALSEKYNMHKARVSGARSLSARSMSHTELSKKLRGRGYTDEQAESAALWFEELGIIDDTRYAAVCAAYYKERGYGVLRIREELRRRGIERETAEAVIAELPESDVPIDRLIEKKTNGKMPDADEKRRLTAFLVRRGFKYDEIRAAFARLQIDTEDMTQ